VVKEGVRSYMSEHGITHLREMSPRETMDMQWELLRSKRVREGPWHEWIADRTTADNVAYALHWLSREDELHKELSSYTEMCARHLGSYEMVFFFPWGRFALEDDGIRSAKPMYQREISYLIDGILHDTCTRHHHLIETATDRRCTEILEVYRKWAGPHSAGETGQPDVTAPCKNGQGAI
jgi:hypothetical protein